MKTADVLRNAKALIDTPEKWSGGTDDNRSRLTPVEAIANAASQSPNGLVALGVFRYANAIPHEQSVFGWNMNASHPEVMAAFDKAIALAESEGT